MILNQRLKEVLRSPVLKAGALGGSSLARVSRIQLQDGRDLVLKQPLNGELSLEGRMLLWLEENTELAVPRVHLCEPESLVMDYIPSQPVVDLHAYETHAAQCLAKLHSKENSAYGFDFDTLIASFIQPNPWTRDWVPFLMQSRLLPMASLALKRGNLKTEDLLRIEKLEAPLQRVLGAGNPPSLIHGDLWGGNILTGRDQVQAFIDPAISYSDPEIELAFTTMFHTFSERFYDVYHEIRPIPNGFFEERADLYLIYPYLVHTAAFGGAWVRGVRARLDRLGV